MIAQSLLSHAYFIEARRTMPTVKQDMSEQNTNRMAHLPQEDILQVLESHPKVLAAFLFGSQVEGYATSQSDVDLAILYDGEIDWREQARLADELEALFGGVKVDVVDARRLPLPLQHRVIRGRIIYERDPDRVSDFIQRVIVRYLDFLPDLRAYQQEFDRAMELAYGH